MDEVIGDGELGPDEKSAVFVEERGAARESQRVPLVAADVGALTFC